MRFNWNCIPFFGFFGLIGYLAFETKGCLVGLAVACFISMVFTR